MPRRTPKRPQLTDLQRQLGQGLSLRAVQKQLVKQGVSLSLEGIRKIGLRSTPTRKIGTGPTPKLTSQAKRRVVNAVRRDPFISLGALRCQEAPNVSDMTLSRILKAAGLPARRARTKPFLTPITRKKRLSWAQAHLHWTPQQWRSCIFSDETALRPLHVIRRTVRRQSGTAHELQHTQPALPYGGGPPSHAWGAITGNGIRRLLFYEPTLTSEKYIQLLGEFFSSLPPSRSTHKRHRVFLQDNAPCHSTTAVRTYLQQHVTLDCLPPSSPDLNVIENCWALLKRRLLRKHMNAGELQQAGRDAWHSIPVAVIADAVASMPARCRAVVAARGGPTRF